MIDFGTVNVSQCVLRENIAHVAQLERIHDMTWLHVKRNEGNVIASNILCRCKEHFRSHLLLAASRRYIVCVDRFVCVFTYEKMQIEQKQMMCIV